MIKELLRGMLIAIGGKSDIPTIGEVVAIEPNPNLDSKCTYTVYKQETYKKKPKWLRYFSKTASTNDAKLGDIILYDFSLTKNGAIRKSMKDFLTTV